MICVCQKTSGATIFWFFNWILPYRPHFSVLFFCLSHSIWNVDCIFVHLVELFFFFGEKRANKRHRWMNIHAAECRVQKKKKKKKTGELESTSVGSQLMLSRYVLHVCDQFSITISKSLSFFINHAWWKFVCVPCKSGSIHGTGQNSTLQCTQTHCSRSDKFVHSASTLPCTANGMLCWFAMGWEAKKKK